MKRSDVHYDPANYIRTNTNDLVSRKAALHGSQNLYLKGKTIIMPGVVVRGELHTVRVGRYCYIGEGTIIRPAYRVEPDGSSGMKCKFTPLTVGNYTRIGRDCVVQAAAIGSGVRIGDGCIIGRNCLIRDNCSVEAGTVLAEGTVVPPFSVVRGAPGKVVEAVHESAHVARKEDAVSLFQHFKPIPTA